MLHNDPSNWTTEFWESYRDDLLALCQGDARFRRMHYILEAGGTIRAARDLTEWQHLVSSCLRKDGTFGYPRVGLDRFGDGYLETLFTGFDADGLVADASFVPRCFLTAITDGALDGYEGRTRSYGGAARLHQGLAVILENGDAEALRAQEVLLDQTMRTFVLASGPQPRDSWERIKAEVVPILNDTDFTLLYMVTMLEHEVPSAAADGFACSGSAEECRASFRNYLASAEWKSLP